MRITPLRHRRSVSPLGRDLERGEKLLERGEANATIYGPNRPQAHTAIITKCKVRGS